MDGRLPIRRAICKRAGFTLVELLIALGILLILSTILVAFGGRLMESRRANAGADFLQKWLAVAKQRALRDQIPTGVRLLTASNGLVTQAVYVQQPPDLTFSPKPGTVQSTTTTLSADITAAQTSIGVASAAGILPSDVLLIESEQVQVASISGTTLTVVRGFAGTTAATHATGTATADLDGITLSGSPSDDFVGSFSGAFQNVLPGDLLQAPLGSKLYRVTAVIDATHLQILGAGAPTSPIAATGQYRFVRNPRPLQGEDPLQLPQDVVIDITTNSIYGNVLPTNPFDASTEIIFGPDGRVIGQGAATAKIILWVRDVSQGNAEQSLIAVYTRTGFVAAHPADTSTNTRCLAAPTSGSPGSLIVESAMNISPGAVLFLVERETVQVSAVAGTTITLSAGVTNNYPSGTALRSLDAKVATTCTAAVTAGSTTITVADATNIAAGSSLLLVNEESVLVTVVSGNTVTVSQILNSYPLGTSVLSDPYVFTRDGRTSGM